MKWSLSMLLLGVLQVLPRPGLLDFERERIGREPRDFFFSETGRGPEGKWRIFEDGKNRVLAQLNGNRADDRWALAVVKDTSLKDLRLSVKIKIVKGESARAGGLVWRYKNSKNYLAVLLDAHDRAVRLYRVVDGNRVRFGGEGERKLKTGEWFTLRIEHKNNLIKVYLDGEMLFDARDKHFPRAGRFGLVTRADSIVYLDDLQNTKMGDG